MAQSTLPSTSFKAPWSLSLKLITLFSVCLFLGFAGIGAMYADSGSEDVVSLLIALPIAIVVGAVFFVIRGYDVDLPARKLVVHRLGWTTTLDLAPLTGVEINPLAMKHALQVFGNGGLFCFAGRFWNKRLGFFRAYATDPERAVILRFPQRVIVVTPADPSRFERVVSKLMQEDVM